MAWTAANILKLHRKTGQSNVAFARLVGVSIMTLWRWETGNAFPAPLSKRRLDEVEADVKSQKPDEAA